MQLPKDVGVAFKPQHIEALLQQKTPISWLEVHPENYMGDGGLPHAQLTQVAEHFPLSMHGVGMSLGSIDGVSGDHLARLKLLVDRYQPSSVSEHLAWSHWNQVFFNDLLPLPYTEESLRLVSANIQHVQDTLKRPILIENPSLYLEFSGNEFSEPEFLNTLCEKTSCGLLLDVNNIFVSAHNLGTKAADYLSNIDVKHIGEVHLAGHSLEMLEDGQSLRIDDHGSEVLDEVWALYDTLLEHIQKPVPTLIEWDTNIPEFETLEQQAQLAAKRLQIFLPMQEDKFK